MLSVPVHDGAPLRPHDLPWAWDLDPVVLGLLAAAALAYRRGWRSGSDGPWRRAAWWIALVVLVVALVSPLEALSGVLVSAHMVQHVLLLVVAAPLLAASAPNAALARGGPRVLRTGARALRQGVGVGPAGLRRARSLPVRWLAHVAVVWVWHASVLYSAAVDHDLVHAAEHATFLATAVLVWSSVLGPARSRVERGAGVLAVFALGLQAVFLSALLTFARSPWYEPYVAAAPGWNVDPLADQQLAGVIMWVPAGLVHVAVGVALAVRWLHELDRVPDRDTMRPPPPSTAPAVR